MQINDVENLMDKALKRFVPGHRTCTGCGAPAIFRSILGSIDEQVVVAQATGCLEVTTTIYPTNTWGVPYIHNAFENAPATMAGIWAAQKRMIEKGELSEEAKLIVFGGDGGTYDIGLQSLSGAIERRHDFLYVCYDNEAYMNTGIQRSSATPIGASTTTTPAGKKYLGKRMIRKDIMEVMAGHKMPYIAQASVYKIDDLIRKVKTAMKIKGPKYLNVISPCPPGWKTDPAITYELNRLAVETNYWPLYEVFDGKKYVVNYKPENRLPIEEFLKPQGRFKHLFKDDRGKEIIKTIQNEVDKKWERLLALEKLG